MKGATTSTLSAKPSYRKTAKETQFLKELFKVLLKFVKEIFSNQLIQNSLQKEQWPAPFVTHPIQSPLQSKPLQKYNL